jgi:excisionase family DNA binding protein
MRTKNSKAQSNSSYATAWSVDTRVPTMDGFTRGRPSRRFLTKSQIADLLGASVRSVSRWIARGDLTAHKLGTLVRVGEDDFRAFLARHRGL